MPDFTLPSTDGKQVSLYDYRVRSNLVLVFAGRTKDSTDSLLLSTLAKRYGEIAETDSEVVVVLAESVAQADEFKRKIHFPVAVLSDSDMQVHKMVGACGALSVPGAALYITDRFLEVFAVWRYS
jgi:thioredoxin-dependent peroxiredoxin